MGKGIKDHNLEEKKNYERSYNYVSSYNRERKGKISIDYYANLPSRYTQPSLRVESRHTLTGLLVVSV